MPPKARHQPLPSSHAELEYLISNRVAAAIAQHEANRTEASHEGTARIRTNGGTV